MKFNILIINTQKNGKKIQDFLDPIEENNIYICNNFDDVEHTLLTHTIHIMILDTFVLDINELHKIINTYIEIPIFISNLDTSINQSDLLIFDYLDIDNQPVLSLNKIKFCYKLWEKEIAHENKIQAMLYIDGLTKFPNRAKLIKDLQDDKIDIVSLAIFDIKSFKEINDFFGHKVGDSILKKVAQIIVNVINSYDEVNLYKFPSDTYCITNSGISNNKFKEITQTIINNIDKKVFHEDQHEIDVRVAAGITFSTKNNKLVTADLALQAAKRDHKDLIVFYDELDNLKEYQNNMLWTKKLKNALEKDNIVVYFQPLVNNKTMKVDKYECLVRMIDEDKIISPFFFLEVSKKANQYSKITKIVIEKSFREFQNLPFEFSVNVSYEDIEDKDFMKFVKEKLATYGVAKKVVWEILEDEGIKNYDVLQEFTSEVKALGCKVAIDDFGSGYSNFEHLLKMNVDYLKIDASLVKNIATDQNSYEIVKTIMEFAKSLDLQTIAEYVENKEIFKLAKSLGATYSQGYYFSAPLEKPKVYHF